MPDIQYLGHSAFRIRGRDGIVVTDPYDRSVGLDIGKPTAHIVTVSHNHPDHTNVAAVKPMREKMFTIEGPGEYEVNGIMIAGVRTFHDKKKGEELGLNTVYVFHIDDVVFCHLGDLGHELTSGQIDDIGEVDVLFIPVGGGETIGPADAASVIAQLEPRLVVPMHYAIDGQQSFTTELASLEAFLQQVGLKDVQPEDKLTVTPANLPAEGSEAKIVVLRPVA